MRRRVAQLCKSIKTYMDRCWDMSERDLHVHQYLKNTGRMFMEDIIGDISD